MYNNVDDLRATLQNAFVFVFLSFHINYFLQPLGRVHLFNEISIYKCEGTIFYKLYFSLNQKTN